MIGKTVTHYKIIEKLGAGGMGIVYKAQDTRLDRFVALKFLPPHLSEADEEKQRFIHEAKAASALEHKNICNIHEIGETEDGQLFISMAYYEGESLKHKIERGPLPVDEVIGIADQIAQGLAKAHSMGIVHRDIKPANVMITNENEVKILDFGLAKLMGRTQLTKQGATLGTVAYMSPEQTQGVGVDHRTDLWALGAVTYEMITGQQPFAGDYEQAIIYSIVNEEPVPLEQKRSEVSATLSAVVGRLLEKDFAERYQTAEEVLADLQTLRGSTDSVTAVESPPKAKRHGISRRWLIAGIRSAVLIIAIAAVWMLSRFGGEESTKTNSRFSEQRIAVLPFSVGGNKGLDYLEDSMVELLSIGLNEAGGLETVEPNTLLGFLGNDHGAVRDPEQGRRVAAHFSAGHFILGSIIQLGGQIRFNAAMYNAAGQFQKRAEAETSDEEKLPAVVDSLMVQLIGGLVEKPLQETVSIAAKTTHSFKALKAYLQGDYLLRLGKDDEAFEAYREATRLDSTFALAWLSSPDWEVSDRMIKKYWDKLPERNQRLYEVENSAIGDDSTDFEEKRRLCLKLVEDYPDFAAARYFYADYYLFHEGWIAGHLSSEARPYFEQALQYDPNNAELISHLPELVIKAGEFDVLDSLLRRCRDRLINYYNDRYFLGLQILSAAGHNDQSRFEALIEKFVAAPPSHMHWLLPFLLAQWLEDVPRALYANHQLRSMEPEEDRGYWLLREGICELAAGRLRHGDSLLTEFYSKVTSAQPDRARGVQLQVLTRFCNVHPVQDKHLLALRKEIEQWDTTRVGPWGEPMIKVLYTALINYRIGEKASFEKARYEFEQLSAKKGEKSVEYAMALTLRTLSYWQNGQGVKALAALDDASRAVVAENMRPPPRGLFPMPGRPSWTSAPASYLVLNMYLRAEILFSEERYQDALPWYAVLNDNAPWGQGFMLWGFPFLGPSLLRRAQIYEHLGNQEKAVEFYSRIARLWQNCDPELRHYVKDARTRIDALAKK